MKVGDTNYLVQNLTIFEGKVYTIKDRFGRLRTCEAKRGWEALINYPEATNGQISRSLRKDNHSTFEAAVRCLVQHVALHLKDQNNLYLTNF